MEEQKEVFEEMKEKLMEILRNPIYPHLDVDPIEALADYLIDSGVVVPVHCNDCQYGMYAGLGKFMCGLHDFVGKAYFYCADGVRKDND